MKAGYLSSAPRVDRHRVTQTTPPNHYLLSKISYVQKAGLEREDGNDIFGFSRLLIRERDDLKPNKEH